MTKNDLSRYRWQSPSLDLAEERDLLRKAKAGDRRAMEKLLQSFHRLVLSIAGKSHGDRDDIIAAGVLGLMEAIQAFDLRHSARFSTIAKPYIQKRMREELKQDVRHGMRGETRADKWLWGNPGAAVEEIVKATGCSQKAAEEARERASGLKTSRPYDDDPLEGNALAVIEEGEAPEDRRRERQFAVREAVGLESPELDDPIDDEMEVDEAMRRWAA